ncbi:MAG: hypothetical protein IEMM0002_0985 [bacterium]|nr:MAG: hypothetical protein IEMM0002_0985 [bacterium]
MKMGFNPLPADITAQQKNDLAKLKKLSQQYESFFMKEVVSAMRRSVPKSDLLNGGNAEEIYKSMLDEQWSAHMAESGDTGIAQSIYNMMSKAYLDMQAYAGNGEAK